MAKPDLHVPASLVLKQKQEDENIPIVVSAGIGSRHKWQSKPHHFPHSWLNRKRKPLSSREQFTANQQSRWWLLGSAWTCSAHTDMRPLWTCAHPYCSVHALSQGYLGLADVPGSPGQKWFTSLHRIIRLLTKGHNWYGRSRASARSGCMKLNTQGSAARGELAIIFLLIHSPFRPLNIFVTVLSFPTRHVRNTCKSISGWCYSRWL